MSTTTRPPMPTTPHGVLKFWRDLSISKGIKPARYDRVARQWLATDVQLPAYCSNPLLHSKPGNAVLVRLGRKLCYAHNELLQAIKYGRADDDEDNQPPSSQSPVRRPMPDDDDGGAAADRDNETYPDGVQPEFHGRVMKCVKHGYPHLDDLHTDWAEKYGKDTDTDADTDDPDDTSRKRSEDGLDNNDTSVTEDESQQAVEHMRVAHCRWGEALRYVRAKGRAANRQPGRFSEAELQKALRYIRKRPGASWEAAQRYALTH